MYIGSLFLIVRPIPFENHLTYIHNRIMSLKVLESCGSFYPDGFIRGVLKCRDQSRHEANRIAIVMKTGQLTPHHTCQSSTVHAVRTHVSLGGFCVVHALWVLPIGASRAYNYNAAFDQLPAVLAAWRPGEEAGTAVWYSVPRRSQFNCDCFKSLSAFCYRRISTERL